MDRIPKPYFSDREVGFFDCTGLTSLLVCCKGNDISPCMAQMTLSGYFSVADRGSLHLGHTIIIVSFNIFCTFLKRFKMKEIKCLRCKGILFKTVPLDEKGNRSILSGTGLPIQGYQPL